MMGEKSRGILKNNFRLFFRKAGEQPAGWLILLQKE
jgi:hypothetical protein